MKEQETTIETRDGPMTVFAAWPETTEVVPGIIIHMDIYGLREEIFDFARRFASNGYAAFVPDLYHRLPVTRFAPSNVKRMGRRPDVTSAGEGTTLDHGITDTAAVLRHAEALSGVSIGTFGAVGYCMGGRHAIAAGNAFPERIPAIASIHGGKLVDDTGRSPHQLLMTYPGEVYFAFAKDDATCPDDHQKLLEETLAAGPAQGGAKHFDARHGWSFPERWCYDPAVDEAVWRDLFELFERRLK